MKVFLTAMMLHLSLSMFGQDEAKKEVYGFISGTLVKNIPQSSQSFEHGARVEYILIEMEIDSLGKMVGAKTINGSKNDKLLRDEYLKKLAEIRSGYTFQFAKNKTAIAPILLMYIDSLKGEKQSPLERLAQLDKDMQIFCNLYYGDSSNLVVCYPLIMLHFSPKQ